MEFIDGQLTAGREKLREGKRTMRGKTKEKEIGKEGKWDEWPTIVDQLQSI